MIPPSFAALCGTSRDDADDVVAAILVDPRCIGHNQNLAFDHADAVEPFLASELSMLKISMIRSRYLSRHSRSSVSVGSNSARVVANSDRTNRFVGVRSNPLHKRSMRSFN
jgi:hypothetical protein